MIKKKSVHVVPNSNGGWDVKKDNSKKASKHTATQLEAITVGRKLAKKNKTSLKIHNTEGQIREERSYGNDPNPPKDKH